MLSPVLGKGEGLGGRGEGWLEMQTIPKLGPRESVSAPALSEDCCGSLSRSPKSSTHSSTGSALSRCGSLSRGKLIRALSHLAEILGSSTQNGLRPVRAPVHWCVDALPCRAFSGWSGTLAKGRFKRFRARACYDAAAKPITRLRPPPHTRLLATVAYGHTSNTNCPHRRCQFALDGTVKQTKSHTRQKQTARSKCQGWR